MNIDNKILTTNQIRDKFLQYFANKGHTIVKSSSLVPYNDQTLLFTNAGMNQFKDVFLDLDTRNYVRATSAQKCVRAGGKHNDLENVGYTARHHTFFEMLGNFSFGDYFKQDAIQYAWDFLTVVLQIPQNKLYVTVYINDDESYNIWHKQIGLPLEKIIRIGDKDIGGSDNFWQMGDTGPCGPCTEIFYDHGVEIEGGLPGSDGEEGDRYIEIWNCVFMQFNRDESGQLKPLAKLSVDTGMGLERISAVMQHVNSNYEIDLFKNIIDSVIKIIRDVTIANDIDITSASLKVIADHIRSISFLIADGVIPSNEGRGYVLRRIIRRAVRHGYKLDCRKPFLWRLVEKLSNEMGNTYSELISQKKHIEDIIRDEEEKFFQTIQNGMGILKNELDNLLNQPDTTKNPKILDGLIAFKLYDTYGFPMDLTADICREVGVLIDEKAFNLAMSKQQTASKEKNSSKFKISNEFSLDFTNTNPKEFYDTLFVGYNDPNVVAKIIAIYKNDNTASKESLKSGESGIIVLDKTVLYAEGGGQIGDIGILQKYSSKDNQDKTNDALFSVIDTQKIRTKTIGHFGNLQTGELNVGDLVIAKYDIEKRLSTMRNHSVTHLLHKALHLVIGISAIQKGSFVCSEYTRFDFAHKSPLKDSQIIEIERIVNNAIMRNYPVNVSSMTYDDALKQGAMALFEEKYANEVRVIKMGNFSIELCGGTHVKQTGEIGLFRIVSESGVSNGIRRIEAVTGDVAIQNTINNSQVLKKMCGILKAQNNDVLIEKINNLLDEKTQLTKQICELNAKLSSFNADKLFDKVVNIHNNIKLIALVEKKLDSNILLGLIDKLKDKLISGIIIIASVQNATKADIVVSITNDLINKYKAPDILNYLTSQLDGRGGGRPELARGSVTNTQKLDAIFNTLQYFIESK